MVGRDTPVLSNVEGPVLSGVEGLIPAYNVFLLIEKWNYTLRVPLGVVGYISP